MRPGDEHDMPKIAAAVPDVLPQVCKGKTPSRTYARKDKNISFFGAVLSERILCGVLLG